MIAYYKHDFLLIYHSQKISHKKRVISESLYLLKETGDTLYQKKLIFFMDKII